MAWRPPRLRTGLICGSVLAGLVAACTPAEPLSVRIAALDWVAPGGDPVLLLTTKPSTCLTQTSDAALMGELLFNSPLLLGGQAAKAELHCASCHVNGRGNGDFAFQGVSGNAGTADVTHGLFGPARSDDTFNPVPIPDLAMPEGQSRVDRDTAGILEAFLAAQIIEEFSGPAPAETTIDALAAYIRAVDHGACRPTDTEPLTWRDDIQRVETGLRLLEGARDGSVIDKRAVANAMRAALGRLYARYPAGRHAPLRQRLLALSRAIDGGQVNGVGEEDLKAIEGLLAKHEDGSLFNPTLLRLALADRENAE
ncbi:MAG: hypothetical protein AAF829_03335 [Pseudomonadota bacterium]